MESMSFKQWLRQNRDNIISGIIASIIFTILPKIISMTPAFGGSIYSLLVNIIYSYSASWNSEMMSSLIFSMFFALVLSSTVIRIVFNCNNRRREKRYNNEETISKEIAKIKKRIKVYKSIRCLFTVIFILFIYYPMVLFHRFENDLIAIRPYIRDEEYYLIQSNWVQMKSKDDYDEIYERINDVIQQNGLSVTRN